MPSNLRIPCSQHAAGTGPHDSRLALQAKACSAPKDTAVRLNLCQSKPPLPCCSGALSWIWILLAMQH